MSSIVFSDFGDPAFTPEFARRRRDRAERVAGRIAGLAGIGEGDRVVDLCCGPGLVAAQLAERVRATGEVIGIDSSPAMISLAREAARGGNAHFLEGDACAFSALLERPVDHVVATSAWQNFLTDRKRVLDELARALKPRGRPTSRDRHRNGVKSGRGPSRAAVSADGASAKYLPTRFAVIHSVFLKRRS